MSALVQAARRYLGVRFVHQGRSEHGLDCVGLVWIAYRDCGVTLDAYRAYPAEPNPREMINRISDALGMPVANRPVPTSVLRPGDVVLMLLVGESQPHHVGLIGDYPYGGRLSVIHAHSMAAPRGRVVEHRLGPSMAARITHVFRRPI